MTPVMVVPGKALAKFVLKYFSVPQKHPAPKQTRLAMISSFKEGKGKEVRKGGRKYGEESTEGRKEGSTEKKAREERRK
jgi:hypothetical protein